MINRLVILAGGISSRMKQSGALSTPSDMHLLVQADERTKGMIGVGSGDRPFIDYHLYNAKTAGLTDVVIVIGERDTTTRQYYGSKEANNEFHGLNISYAVQSIPNGRSKPPGTADALLQALRSRKDWQGEYFIVCNSDNLYSIRALKLLCALKDIGGFIDYDIDGLAFDENRIAQFGITQKDHDGFLTGIIEKPSREKMDRMKRNEDTLRVTMNIWRLNYDTVLPFLEHCPINLIRQEKELPTAIGNMVKAFPRSIKAIPLKEHVPDLTYKDDIARVQEYLRQNFGELDWGERS